MSIRAVYMVQCSGPCERFLASRDGGAEYNLNRAIRFEDWGEADRAAALAGWHDGSVGQYASCRCPGDCCGWNTFCPECRLNRPYLVPICPECRVRL